MLNITKENYQTFNILLNLAISPNLVILIRRLYVEQGLLKERYTKQAIARIDNFHK